MSTSDFFSRAYGHLALPVMVTDVSATIVYVNTAFTEATGHQADELLGKNPRILQSGLTRPELHREMWRALTAGENWHGKLINRDRRGRNFIESLHISPVTDTAGDVTHYVGLWLDVTEDIADRERLLVSARTDELTGTLNRRGLVDQLDKELHRARRHRRPLCAVLVDLDDFKTVNDRLGHAVGDAVMRTVAKAITNSVRQEDVVGRYGGDEFLVLLPEAKPGLARLIADRVIAAVREEGGRIPAIRATRGLAVSCSAGVAHIETAGKPELDLIVSKLDQQLSAAKASGKNRVSSAEADVGH